MKRSAGVLVYRKVNEEYEILLAHFGGPYWLGMDEGAWSIPKGIKNDGEKNIEAAIREFSEETNLVIDSEVQYLASKKVSKKKLVIMYMAYYDEPIANFKSNTFEKEWPKGSGNVCIFPEMDQIKWFTIKDAKRYIHKSQLFFIHRFDQKVNMIK